MSKPGNGWHDVYKTGRVRHNRVTIFRRRSGGVFMIRFRFRGETVNRSLKTRNALRARRMADGTAKNIAAQLDDGRTAHAKPSDLMAMKADLERVARRAGAPAGHAPPLLLYRDEGRYTPTAVRAAYDGYEYDPVTGNGNPRLQWSEALRRFGLKPYHVYRNTSADRVGADVRRVARQLGNPRRLPTRLEYEEHGQWSATTVLNRLRVGGWADVARALHLDIEAYRARKASQMRGNNYYEGAA